MCLVVQGVSRQTVDRSPEVLVVGICCDYSTDRHVFFRFRASGSTVSRDKDMVDVRSGLLPYEESTWRSCIGWEYMCCRLELSMRGIDAWN